ncbi:MAG: DHHA1 domain-containing protein, partial [Candidatus Hydrogenedentes bacterium]|nr:DHHA1 domain-containing protein [Candidatus Hydrogenedentota bacterium]
DPQTTKVSIRANDPFNAAAFLAAYGGGGHKAAAGATVHAPLNTVRADIIDQAIKLLGEGK